MEKQQSKWKPGMSAKAREELFHELVKRWNKAIAEARENQIEWRDGYETIDYDAGWVLLKKKGEWHAMRERLGDFENHVLQLEADIAEFWHRIESLDSYMAGKVPAWEISATVFKGAALEIAKTMGAVEIDWNDMEDLRRRSYSSNVTVKDDDDGHLVKVAFTDYAHGERFRFIIDLIHAYGNERYADGRRQGADLLLSLNERSLRVSDVNRVAASGGR